MHPIRPSVGIVIRAKLSREDRRQQDPKGEDRHSLAVEQHQPSCV
jgi:hypothetical protein